MLLTRHVVPYCHTRQLSVNVSHKNSFKNRPDTLLKVTGPTSEGLDQFAGNIAIIRGHTENGTVMAAPMKQKEPASLKQIHPSCELQDLSELKSIEF